MGGEQSMCTPAGRVQPALMWYAAGALQIRTLKGGHIYRGGVLKGMKQGLGQLAYSNGCEYDGKFDADEMDGHGVFTFASGGLYQGQVTLQWASIVSRHVHDCCWTKTVRAHLQTVVIVTAADCSLIVTSNACSLTWVNTTAVASKHFPGTILCRCCASFPVPLFRTSEHAYALAT
jgi:MORN repeat